MMLLALLELALRSLLLGAAIGIALKLFRLSDLKAQTAIWTLVLLAALGMPFLSRALPAWLVLPLPILSFSTAAPPVLSATNAMAAPAMANPGLAWHLTGLAWACYCLVALTFLTRLAIGLVLTLRLYRAAEPVTESWARGKAIRASAALEAPISFAACILLPADYSSWSEAKREAVLAHEEAHIARGDFFIQLLAMIHRALFWFSPFAWWLQFRLAELAETASDEAAIGRLNDRASYAEILIDVSRRAHPQTAVIAMAKGPGIPQRVERILSDIPERRLSLPLRLLVIASLAPLALAFAGARAEIIPAPSLTRPLPLLLTSPRTPRLAWPSAQAETDTRAANPPAPVAAAPHAARSARKAARPAPAEDAVSYNPRALLDEPEAVIVPALLPTAKGAGKNSADAAILLNLGGE